MTGQPHPGGSPLTRQLPLQVVAALSDPKVESALLPGLLATGRIDVESCTSARELLETLRGSRGRTAAVLTQADLPHLSEGALDEITRLGLPLVVLAHHPDDPRWAA